jgi:hypothetical protein
MNNADPKRVAQASFYVIDKLQNFPPHLQLMGLAAALLTASDTFKVEAQDIFTVTKNLMNSKEGLRPEFAAIRDYIKYELKP